MGQDTFNAGVQYNDWTGTAAADNHDIRSFSSYLEKEGHIQKGEALVGIELSSSQLPKDIKDGPVRITALVASAHGYDDLKAAVDSEKPLHVRRIDLQMPLVDFFAFFKRFKVAISSKGLIDGREIEFDD